MKINSNGIENSLPTYGFGMGFNPLMLGSRRPCNSSSSGGGNTNSGSGSGTGSGSGSGTGSGSNGTGTTGLVISTLPLTGTAPAGATIGIDSSTGNVYYVDSTGKWKQSSSSSSTVVSVVPLTGTAPIGSTGGIDITTGIQYYVDAGGNWKAVPCNCQGLVSTSTSPLTGTAPAGATTGIDTTTGIIYYVDSTGKWQPTHSPDTVTSTTPLTGVAPAGAETGVDISTGKMYYVDASGNWQPVPTVTPATPLIGTIVSVSIDQNITAIVFVPIVGVVLGNHYNYAVTSVLPNYIECAMNVSSNGVVRVALSNQTGLPVVLSNVTISVLPL
jgi:hypothetical protein